jgi:outer membrane protein OmpA-like peptidoglycan-associated protein
VKRGGATTWVHVRARDQGEAYVLDIVEGKAMAQEVTADAGALAADLAATGKAAVYGIYFDTGKAEVKPESRPALEQIAAVLVRDPSLRLHVVGHTDAIGDVAMNLKLSQARAEAVVKELTTRHGVAAARLRPAGVGPLAPAASNRDEAGRARNRRVELVAW